MLEHIAADPNRETSRRPVASSLSRRRSRPIPEADQQAREEIQDRQERTSNEVVDQHQCRVADLEQSP